MDKYIGRLLDNRYEILEIIGTGGMAVVYKARCHRLNRLVAIKILKDDYLEDEEFRRRFHSESQAVAMLSHPNIVSVYDVSTSITADYIVMELIDGITLKQYMEKKGVLNWKETLHFAMQIAKALEHAHSRGIVHRDIKPHNVMVLKNGSVKVTDFGIARMMSKGNTLTKEALGSVHYISPEQAKGGRVDNRSDIYSLGVVMYEMMSGRPPYDGESPVAVAIQHINGGAVMPSTLNPNIPGGLEQIIMKAMAHETGDRYATATQMLTDLDEFRKNPAILFDYNTPPIDEVTKLQKPLQIQETPPAKTTAERVEQQTNQSSRAGATASRRTSASQRSQSRQPARSRTRAAEEEKHSNAATIAIIACSAVMVVAIIVFLVVLLNGGTGAQPELIEAPALVGQMYDQLPDYRDFTVKIDQEVYDNQNEAGKIINQTPAAGDKLEKGKTIYVTVSKGKATGPVLMPDFTQNWEATQAKRNLNNLSMNLQIIELEEYHDTVAQGYVIRTEPEAQTELKVGQKIKLYISKGLEVKTSVMPNVVGDKKDSALKILDSQGLGLDIIVEDIFDSTVPEGDVVRTEPATGEELITGQQVKVFISKGAEKKKLQNLVGLSVETAVSLLKGDNFLNYEIVPVASNEPKDTVVEQSEKAWDVLDVNTKIILKVSKGPNTTPQVTKDVTIELRDITNSGECRVQVKRGDEIVFDSVVSQHTDNIIIPDQTGSGTVYYEVIPEDGDGWIEKVSF